MTDPTAPHDFEPMRGPDDTTCARCLAPHPASPDPTAAGRPDLTPFTEAGRSVVFGPDDTALAYISRAAVLAIEAEARAQGRAEALDVERLARAMATVRDGHDAQWRDYIREATGLAREYAALGGTPDD